MKTSNSRTPVCANERHLLMLAALTRPCYGRAFQFGCGAGELTWTLAQRCLQVVVADVDAQALSQAEQRCERFPNLIAQKRQPEEGPPPGTFDLIILSELGMRLTAAPLRRLVLQMAAQLQLGGELIAIHSRVKQVLRGDEVHGLMAAHLPLEWQGGERCVDFRIDRWARL